jgi:pentatricopeptide repeat protein
MVYAKTFTKFARHAFQKAAYTSQHASQGAGQASSFFNQSFAGAGRSQLGSGAIANRFQSQFGFHSGKNNPSQGTSQTTLYGPLHNSVVASASNDDGSREREAIYRSPGSITRHLRHKVFASVGEVQLAEASGARRYSTSAAEAVSSDEIISESEPPYSDIQPPPNLPVTSTTDGIPSIELYEKEVTSLMEKGDFDSVISVYHEMKEQGFVPTARLYNSIILSMSRTRSQKPVNDIVDAYTEMLDQQIQPEITTISTVIEALCQRSFEVAEIIDESKLRIARDASNSAEEKLKVEMLKQEENVTTALNLFNASAGATYHPHSVQTFNAILEALGSHGMAEDVLHVYEKMEAANVSPTVYTFIHLINAFGMNGDMRSAIECYNEYKSQATAIPSHDENLVYEALISSYFAAGDSKGGVEFLKKVQCVPAKYISRKLLDAVVAGLSKSNEIAEALKWAHQMEKTATLPNPTVSTIRPILRAASKSADLTSAKEAFDIIAKSRIGTGHLWKAELQLFANLCLQEGDLHTAVIIVDEFLLQKIMLDADIAASFLKKVAESSGVDRCIEFLERFAQVALSDFTDETAKIEFESVLSLLIPEIAPVDYSFISRLLHALHPFPSVLAQIPSPAARQLVASFKKLSEDTSVDGITLAGLIKIQSAPLGWEDMQPEDPSDFISLLCTLHPDEWTHLHPAREFVTDNLERLGDAEILGMWNEIMNALDLAESQGVSVFSPSSIESVQSNYSPDDSASVGTMDTTMTGQNSGFSSYSLPLRQLPTQYHFNVPRTRDLNVPQSLRIIRNLNQAHRDPAALNRLLDVVRFARRRRERLLPEALGRLISTAGKARRIDIVNEVFEYAQTTVREVLPEHEVAFSEWCLILNSMIVANAFNRNFGEARLYQQELLNLGVAPDSDSFAAYIVNLNVTDTNDEATEALALFHEAKSLGVQPSTFLYNTLISKLAKARRSDDALFYFHEMRMNGIVPSSVTFGTVINACCRVGNEALALKYFSEMEADAHFVPRIAPYNTMLQFYVQTKQDRAQALRFYEKMRAQLLTPSAHTYKLLMDAYATLEPVDVQAAENILKLIASDGLKPTSAHYAALIHGHGSVKQDLETAKQWFYQAIDSQNNNRVTPDETLYQALIEAYVANHKVSECQEIFSHMQSNNVRLTVYMANHLIHGWTIAGNLTEARRVFDSLATEKNGLYGREPSSYEQMTRTYLAMGDRSSALALVEEMKSRGYPAAVVGRVIDILEGGEGFNGVVINKMAEESRL